MKKYLKKEIQLLKNNQNKNIQLIYQMREIGLDYLNQIDEMTTLDKSQLQKWKSCIPILKSTNW
jgi:hypothetical protein